MDKINNDIDFVDIDILIEDLDMLVDIARQETAISTWLGLTNSATQIKNMLKKQKNRIYKQ